MYEKLRRSYKTISPGETVANIKRILGEIGFETRPVNQLNPYNGIYSLSIFLEGLGVTTHGKGHNRELALASGYAEFMERLQNSTVKLLTAQRLNPYQNLHSKYNFYLYPDEKELTKAEFENTINEIIAANFANNKKEKDNYRTAAMFYKNRVVKGNLESVALPFFDTRQRKTVYLPAEFLFNLCGTTGMCAGNDPAEALCQGMFEIIERYAARKAYFERLTPPTIPDDFLKDYAGQLSIVNEICKREHLEIAVKDFSCGIGLPAVGILIKNRQTNTYHVHCAGETSFAVGLHRCLTETYQNFNNINYRMRNKIPEREYDYMLKEDEESKIVRFKNWIDWMHHGGGAFPKSILEDRPSYAFDRNIYQTENNYTDELKKLIRIFWNFGKNVYIRDNSFLGFPSYWIYIPHANHETDDILGQFLYYSREKVINIGKVLEERDKQELKELLENLMKQPSDEEVTFHYYYMSIKMLKESHLIENNVSFLMAMLYFYFDEYQKCVSTLQQLFERYSDYIIKNEKARFQFFDLPEEQTNEYFQILIEHVQNINSGRKSHSRFELLEKWKDQALVDKAIALFENKFDLLDRINIFPRCPNCEKCKMTEWCGTKGSHKMAERVYGAFKQNKVAAIGNLNLVCG